METTAPTSLLAMPWNWTRGLPQFLKDHPRDPLSGIVSRDRDVIDSLIPKLNDRSPTRGYRTIGLAGEMPRVPRVCDMALLAIEYHSQCRFHLDAYSPKPFHELPEQKRAQTIRHIEQWWKENKEKPLAAGIRAQIPHARFVDKVWMAKNLATMGDKRENPDREYAVELLKKLVKENWGGQSAHAANALAEVGDFSSLDVFYERFKKTLTGPARNYESSVVWYLTKHGGRREWELLH